MIYFHQSRKGALTLNETIMLVFAFLVVLGLWAFSSKLYAAVFTEKDDGSLANFEKLYAALKEILQTNEKPYTILNYFLGENKALVAFDTSAEKIATTIPNIETLYKPFACGKAACICLYDTDRWSPSEMANPDKGVISCKSQDFSGKNINFYALPGAPPQTSGKEGAANSARYVVYKGDKNTPVFRLYVGKQVATNNQYGIYISPIDESNPQDPATDRKSAFDRKQTA